MNKSSLTIVNNKEFKGVLAPSKIISKEVLEDIVDFIELSSSESIRETEERAAEANRDNSWMSLKEIRKLSEKSE